jgi:hypothetical protein
MWYTVKYIPGISLFFAVFLFFVQAAGGTPGSRNASNDEKALKAAITTHFGAYQAYKNKGMFDEALAEHEIYMKECDSLKDLEAQKELLRKKIRFGYEKKATQDSITRIQERQIHAVQMDQNRVLRYYLYAGIALTLIFAAFMFNRLRIARARKKIIEEQKREVEIQKHLAEEKQREVLDSIHYAKRIQLALLPSGANFWKAMRRLKGKMDEK